MSRKPKERKPVLEYLKAQGRFRHLLKQPEVLAQIQKDIDEQCAQFGF
jgi:pyruvate ferredoxin oxidoreductase beta subunit